MGKTCDSSITDGEWGKSSGCATTADSLVTYKTRVCLVTNKTQDFAKTCVRQGAREGKRCVWQGTRERGKTCVWQRHQTRVCLVTNKTCVWQRHKGLLLRLSRVTHKTRVCLVTNKIHKGLLVGQSRVFLRRRQSSARKPSALQRVGNLNSLT